MLYLYNKTYILLIKLLVITTASWFNSLSYTRTKLDEVLELSNSCNGKSQLYVISCSTSYQMKFQKKKKKIKHMVILTNKTKKVLLFLMKIKLNLMQLCV